MNKLNLFFINSSFVSAHCSYPKMNMFTALETSFLDEFPT